MHATYGERSTRQMGVGEVGKVRAVDPVVEVAVCVDRHRSARHLTLGDTHDLDSLAVGLTDQVDDCLRGLEVSALKRQVLYRGGRCQCCTRHTREVDVEEDALVSWLCLSQLAGLHTLQVTADRIEDLGGERREGVIVADDGEVQVDVAPSIVVQLNSLDAAKLVDGDEWLEGRTRRLQIARPSGLPVPPIENHLCLLSLTVPIEGFSALSSCLITSLDSKGKYWVEELRLLRLLCGEGEKWAEVSQRVNQRSRGFWNRPAPKCHVVHNELLRIGLADTACRCLEAIESINPFILSMTEAINAFAE
jgi:hypothetical protein